jgi:hypothetical protein
MIDYSWHLRKARLTLLKYFVALIPPIVALLVSKQAEFCKALAVNILLSMISAIYLAQSSRGRDIEDFGLGPTN